MGLIVDRAQLCAALRVSDSTISAWEGRGMPTVRKGRGRGMKSLYDLDAVREWCELTGYGNTDQALRAALIKPDPPALPPPSQMQTSAPPPAVFHLPWGRALDGYDI